ncbi:phage baseplate assembly protein [Roseospira navarrensis]|uniref:Phage tail protein n=1 Tax=Roseospira navarrensis TaxID=140058 RepID=A0A7X1ZG73_9PROT|nr:contractile injection system protein, VgrG/Pvc8 family [Roseospira navarrensis]MQX36812.1 hypothetical protein [Roseospira navarrensis]
MSTLPTDLMVLELGDQLWRGWTSVSVTRSIEAVAGAFDLTLTRRTGARLRIPLGGPCRVSVEDERGRRTPVLTGYIDDVEPSYDAQSHEVTVRGRDAAGDLVDCSAIHLPSGEWHGVTLDQIARDLVAPYGISVRAAADTGPAFASFRIQEGETVWDALERACRYRGILAMSDGLGGLVLTTPAQARDTGATLERVPGTRVLSARGMMSHRDRYSTITVKGQSALDDGFGVEAVAAGRASVTDAGVPRHRPLIVLAEEGESLADRAAWERTVRQGRSRRAEITVAGWRDDADALWRPLTLVRVVDPWLALDRAMLIAGVTYDKSDDGTTATLEVVAEGAFDVRQETPPESGGDADEQWVAR